MAKSFPLGSLKYYENTHINQIITQILNNICDKYRKGERDGAKGIYNKIT